MAPLSFLSLIWDIMATPLLFPTLPCLSLGCVEFGSYESSRQDCMFPPGGQERLGHWEGRGVRLLAVDDMSPIPLSRPLETRTSAPQGPNAVCFLLSGSSACSSRDSWQAKTLGIVGQGVVPKLQATSRMRASWRPQEVPCKDSFPRVCLPSPRA